MLNDWPRFTVHPSLVWDNSYNVADNQRINPRTREPWVCLIALTEEQANTEAAKLNAHPPVFTCQP